MVYFGQPEGTKDTDHLVTIPEVRSTWRHVSQTDVTDLGDGSYITDIQPTISGDYSCLILLNNTPLQKLDFRLLPGMFKPQ